MNDLKNLNIKIYTRSQNENLYIHSSRSYSNLPFEKVRLKNTTSEEYLYKLLKSDADIVINIDEDAFVIDEQLIIELIHFMIDNDFVSCGFPDGGVLSIRFHNPLITNPFFNILNIKKLRSRFSFEELNRYRDFKEEYTASSSTHLLKTDFAYDMFEPYYPFFLWISQNFKVLYLDADQHSDGYTTILKNQEGSPFLLHTWYSRAFEKDKFHRERIINIMNEVGINFENNGKNIIESLMNRYYMPTKIFMRRALKKLKLIEYI